MNIDKLLVSLEISGINHFLPVDWMLQQRNPELYENLTALGIQSIMCIRTAGTGRVFLSMPGDGGVVSSDGSYVVSWVGTFLRHKDRRDVLTKLIAANAREKHVFIPISLGSSSWEVESFFLSGADPVTGRPDLPHPVDAVWITCWGRGLLWRNDEWISFQLGSFT